MLLLLKHTQFIRFYGDCTIHYSIACFYFQMKCLSIMMVSFLLVAIAMVSSNETGPNEQSLNRLARAANGGKGEYSFITYIYSTITVYNYYCSILIHFIVLLKHDIHTIIRKTERKIVILF